MPSTLPPGLSAPSAAERACPLRERRRKGLRVLAFATDDLGDDEMTAAQSDLIGSVRNLAFVALVGIIDPLRLEARDAVAVALNAGIDVRREYSVQRDGEWVLLTSPMAIRRGELVRVDLFVSLPTARHFVVVDDPVPGGLEPVNRDLANASLVDAAAGECRPAGGSWWFNFSDWHGYGESRWSFYHQELRHDAVRFYSEYLAPGNYHVSYTAQAIAVGEFTVMPAHAEEMYDPDVYGKSLSGTLTVTEAGP